MVSGAGWCWRERCAAHRWVVVDFGHPGCPRRWGLGGFVALRALVRERVALLRLLGVIGRWRVVGLAVVEVAITLLPAVTAAAVGVLVARVATLATRGGDAASAAGPLAAVGVFLVFDLVAQSLLTPLRDVVALRVNGEIRRKTRRAVLARSGVDHLDDQGVARRRFRSMTSICSTWARRLRVSSG